MPPIIQNIRALKNAGILAAQILALSDSKLTKKIELFKKNMNIEVKQKAKKLQKIGYKKYLA